MTGVPSPRTSDAAEPVAVTLARLEGKVDAALGVQAAAIANHAAEIADHEQRLRTVEAKSTVSPRQLWSAVCSAAGLIALASPFIERIYALHP